jgi:ankyrin repeat protein
LLVESVKKGANVNDKDDTGQTALHKAAGAGQKSAVIALLVLGADMGETDNQGRTPLMAAAEAGNTAVLQLLLHPADVAKLGGDLLKGAGGAVKRAEDWQDRLFAAAREVTQRTDKSGQTAVHKAAAGGHTDCVELLIHHFTLAGYYLNCAKADKQGRTPLALAEAGKHVRAAAVLRRISAVSAAAAGDVGAVTALQKQLGGDFPAALAMSAAVRGGHGKVVAFLKEQWKDKSLAEKQALMEGGPPLSPAIYEAVTTRNAEMARAVLDRAWWKNDTALRNYITMVRSNTTPLTKIEYLREFFPEPISVVAGVLKDLDTKK